MSRSQVSRSGTKNGVVDIDGRPAPVPVDDEAVQEIARLSGVQYFKAASAEEINKVYADLGQHIGYEIRDADASRPWMALGVIALIAAAFSSLLLGQPLP